LASPTEAALLQLLRQQAPGASAPAPSSSGGGGGSTSDGGGASSLQIREVVEVKNHCCFTFRWASTSAAAPTAGHCNSCSSRALPGRRAAAPCPAAPAPASGATSSLSPHQRLNKSAGCSCVLCVGSVAARQCSARLRGRPPRADQLARPQPPGSPAALTACCTRPRRSKRRGRGGKPMLNYAFVDRGPIRRLQAQWVPQLQLHMLATGCMSALLVSRWVRPGGCGSWGCVSALLVSRWVRPGGCGSWGCVSALLVSRWVQAGGRRPRGVWVMHRAGVPLWVLLMWWRRGVPLAPGQCLGLPGWRGGVPLAPGQCLGLPGCRQASYIPAPALHAFCAVCQI